MRHTVFAESLQYEVVEDALLLDRRRDCSRAEIGNAVESGSEATVSLGETTFEQVLGFRQFCAAKIRDSVLDLGRREHSIGPDQLALEAHAGEVRRIDTV